MKVKYSRHLDSIAKCKADIPDASQIRMHLFERDIPYYSEEAWDKFKDSITQKDIFCYPDTDQVYRYLEGTTAAHEDNLVYNSGASSIIKDIFLGFVGPGSKVVTTDPCSTMYQFHASIANADLHCIPYRDRKADIDGIIDSIDDRTSLVIFSNPNCPIGDSISSIDIIRIIKKAKKCKCLVAIDEAYIEFSAALSFLHGSIKEDNVVVIKTYSKALGAAGVRFGFAAGNKQIISVLKTLQDQYCISNFTIKLVEFLKNTDAECKSYINDIWRNKDVLAQGLKDKGHDVYMTDSNWLFTTKTKFHRSIYTAQYILPWDDRVWTRLQIPAKISTLSALINYE